MDETSALCLLESISSNESSRKKFLEALQDPNQEDDGREGRENVELAGPFRRSGNSPPVVHSQSATLQVTEKTN